MHKEITVGNLIAVIASIVFPLVIWGINVERRFAEYNQRITVLERTSVSIDYSLNKIQETQTKILIQLENKKDRE